MPNSEGGKLWKEAKELNLIFTSIITKSKNKERQEKTKKQTEKNTDK